MKNFFALLVVGSGLLCSIKSKAQDIHFSQFYENAIYRNPGLTGIFTGDYKAGVNYRTQWGNISNPFQTVLGSVEGRVMVSEETNDYVSFGLCASYDHAGAIDFNSLQVYPAINYNKSLEDRHGSYLSVGFTGGYIQRSVNMSKMTLDEQYLNGSYNPSNPTGESFNYNRNSHFDLGAGISFNSTLGNNGQVSYYVGGAAFHITRPKEAFNGNEAFVRLSTRYTGNLGFRCRLNSQVGVIVHANYMRQQPYQETIAGALLSWRPLPIEGDQSRNFILYGGAFVRVDDAIIPTLKMDYNTYSFTASYDVTTSSLRPSVSGKGGWEFSFYVRGFGKHRKDNMKCPSFEDGMQQTVF